jgi:acyl-CoA reductase-like NAD-dependent aldehyde dehydrogenase
LLGIIKLSSALLAGNTFIWKPSPFTPNTALKVGELAAKIFPKGVVNVLSGDDSLGPLLTAHPGVAKVSFTGSVATGKKVMQACASTLKRVTLELGGNDAAIIYPDVDLAAVVPQV